MLNFYNSLSPTTKLLIRSLLAVLGSALSGAVYATYQSYITAGRLDIPTLWLVMLGSFAAFFGTAMYAWVPPHAQQIIQAGKENEARLYDALQRAQQIRSAQSLPAVQPVVVQPAPLTADHVASIAAQLAMNLMNIAAQQNTQAQAQAPASSIVQTGIAQVDFPPASTNTNVQPAPVSSRNWNDSALMPVVDVASQQTQSFQAVP